MSNLTVNMDSILELILTALNDVVNYELAVILRLTDRDMLAVQKAHGALNTDRLKDYSIDLKKRTDIANLLYLKEPYLFREDEGHLDTYYDVMDLPGDHSCLLAPLIIQNKVVGMMTLDHSACGMFSENIVRFIGTISKLISLIIAQVDTSRDLIRSRQILAEERNLLLSSQAGILKDVIGSSRAWNIVLEMIKTVAASDLPVLIQGETGTGKEQAAKLIHRLSARSDAPFIALNCSALNINLAESELFGHEKGAFTSAVNQRKGRFELADGGTLFLDEIGDLPPELQPKLLRALQEGSFERVGSEKTITSDVRIVAASNVDLKKAVHEGAFREDLYYRLGVFPVFLPPLRERDQDILLLAEHFLENIRIKNNSPGLRLSGGAVEALMSYSWPGNVREMQNVIQRAALVAGGEEIKAEHLFIKPGTSAERGYEICGGEQNALPGAPAVSASDRGGVIYAKAGGPDGGGIRTLDQAMSDHIRYVLDICEGRIYGTGGAAELLDMKPTTLQSRMKKLGISRVAR